MNESEWYKLIYCKIHVSEWNKSSSKELDELYKKELILEAYYERINNYSNENLILSNYEVKI